MNLMAFFPILLIPAYTAAEAETQRAKDAESGRYHVRSLKWGSVAESSLPLAGTDGEHVAPLTGNSDVRLAASLSQKARTLYYRKRFGHESESLADEYDALYAGQANPGKCYSGLNYFMIRGLPFEEKLRLRYYAEPAHDWYNDIKDVFFQDSLVLSRTSSLFFHPTGAYDSLEKATPVLAPFGCLDIQTSPQGAKVYLGNEFLGSTPFYLSGLGISAPSLKLVLAGHQTLFLSPPVFPESTVHIMDTLVRIPELSEQRPDLQALLKSTHPSHEGFAAIAGALGHYVGTLARQRDSLGSVFNGRYPHFPERRLESRDEENRRRTRYEKEKQRAREELLRPYQSALHAFDTLRNRGATPWDTLKKAKDLFECRLIASKSFSATHLALDAYEPEYEYRTFTAKVEEKHFRFNFRGNLVLSPAENKDLESRIRKGSILVDYWNVPQFDSTLGEYAFYGLRNFRILLDTLLRVESRTGFKFDAASFSAADSARLADRVKSCQIMDIVKPAERKKMFWIASGLAATAATGGMMWYVLSAEGKKEKVYPIPVGPDQD